MQIDISLDGTWRPCAELTLVDPANTSRRGPVTLRYLSSYATDHLFARDRRALFEDVGLEAPALASLAASLNDFGNDLERLPALMAAAGVDAAIIESRREEIARQRRSLAKITAP